MGCAREVVRGRGVTPGQGQGKALISTQPFMFAHGVEPQSGDVIDMRSDIRGENIKGKVLVFPFGKGSTTGSAWFLEAVRLGNGPAAVVNEETEPIIASAIVMARMLYGTAIPLVDRLEKDITDLITRDATVQVNGDTGEVTFFA